MKKRELPELHAYSEDVQELMSRIPSKTVRWGLGIICGLLVAFLVASCFIRCPKYLWLKSRMEYVYNDSIGMSILTGVAYVTDSDLRKLEVGMPIFYRFVECEFKGCIAGLTPKYDPIMQMKSVKLYFDPDEKVHPIYINGYGVPGKVRLSNPTLFECIFLRKKR
ncbi:MAG: hypothetical protein IKY64_05680 [Bacteroidaceae bacterium]|nr:hypothetical protein [Bacteroidaceae bacterium]